MIKALAILAASAVNPSFGAGALGGGVLTAVLDPKATADDILNSSLATGVGNVILGPGVDTLLAEFGHEFSRSLTGVALRLGTRAATGSGVGASSNYVLSGGSVQAAEQGALYGAILGVASDAVMEIPKFAGRVVQAIGPYRASYVDVGDRNIGTLVSERGNAYLPEVIKGDALGDTGLRSFVKVQPFEARIAGTFEEIPIRTNFEIEKPARVSVRSTIPSEVDAYTKDLVSVPETETAIPVRTATNLAERVGLEPPLGQTADVRYLAVTAEARSPFANFWDVAEGRSLPTVTKAGAVRLPEVPEGLSPIKSGVPYTPPLARESDIAAFWNLAEHGPPLPEPGVKWVPLDLQGVEPSPYDNWWHGTYNQEPVGNFVREGEPLYKMPTEAELRAASKPPATPFTYEAETPAAPYQNPNTLTPEELEAKFAVLESNARSPGYAPTDFFRESLIREKYLQLTAAGASTYGTGGSTFGELRYSLLGGTVINPSIVKKLKRMGYLEGEAASVYALSPAQAARFNIAAPQASPGKVQSSPTSSSIGSSLVWEQVNQLDYTPPLKLNKSLSSEQVGQLDYTSPLDYLTPLQGGEVAARQEAGQYLYPVGAMVEEQARALRSGLASATVLDLTTVQSTDLELETIIAEAQALDVVLRTVTVPRVTTPPPIIPEEIELPNRLPPLWPYREDHTKKRKGAAERNAFGYRELIHPVARELNLFGKMPRGKMKTLPAFNVQGLGAGFWPSRRKRRKRR